MWYKFKLLTLGLVLILTVSSIALAQGTVKVTFNVNTATSPKFLVDTSLVEVRGSHPLLGPWGSAPTNRMRNLGGDYWTLTVDFPDTMVGKVLEYKFYAEDWEVGNNYTLTIPSSDTTLPFVFFRKQGFGPNPPYTPTDSIDVWFRVYVYNIPEFDPVNHVIGVRGAQLPSHNDFGDLSRNKTFVLKPEPANDKVWSGRLRFPSPSPIAYKFVIAYKDSPDVVIKWESDPNREVTINRDTTLRWTTFDRKVIAPAKTVNLYFSVDMSVYQMIGYFYPDSGDVVLVCGSFNGWGEQNQLSPSTLEPGIWEGFIPITAAPGDFIEYKYYIKTGTNNQARVPNSGWEPGSNYRYTFTDADTQEVPRRYFAGSGPEGFVQKDEGVEVWIYCDMRGATDKNGDPITRVDSLFVAGSQPPLFWIWNEPTRDRSNLKLHDDGRYPDKVAGDTIYSIAITFPKWSSKGPIQFKFAVNGIVDNEAEFQEDHLLFLDDMPNQTGKKAINELEVVKFGRQRGLGAFKDTVKIVNKFTGVKETGEVPLTYELYQNYPNPFNPTTTIKYSIPNTERVTLKIYNILGQEVATLIDEEQKPGVYELKFDATNLASGVYFYRLQAGKFNAVKKMMLVK
ncbi:carbohydrate-binding module family 20 domain-containing protein [Candidatus Chrysopegis kryptomonas]|uniref:Por secretion system C-terminal sorting domain-containing protein n=1 Tax=Candidatus Chryseopegocella kryptomonas TaxID=1633643 RepID=A0A0P1NTH2_9BACT|nr:carbohydrate-binding module family 20 domain-containing protein [Candidatus Chrysopegis kryptomonas]CUT02297.1 Por secretion system C-terminal sorting domain-containing protein [Candidatus Chrysopegis kryptomonas]